MCDFITDYKAELDYDWYIKIISDVKLLNLIKLFDFNVLLYDAVNARAITYIGPKQIRHGVSISRNTRFPGKGDWAGDFCERYIILDLMVIIFHKNVLDAGAFAKTNMEFTDGSLEWN
jgi:hypothetical protein